MAVQVATLDILTNRAHFTPEVARAIGDAMAMEISLTSLNLATKPDLLELRADTKRELAELRAELVAFRIELKQEIAELRGELKQEMAELRGELKQEIAELRADMKQLRSYVDVRIADAKADIQRWTVAVVSVNTAAIVCAVYFMLQNMR